VCVCVCVCVTGGTVHESIVSYHPNGGRNPPRRRQQTGRVPGSHVTWSIVVDSTTETCASVVDRVKVLLPTRHGTGHFADVLTSQSLGLVSL